jgi:pimeloyl-ACP methyl ester carboxylesterase
MDKTELTAGTFTFRTLTSGPPDGPPVLLLHGFPQSSGEWRSQLEFLGAAGYRCIAPDQRGYSPGARPESVAAYGIDELVDDVINIADALGMGPFDLVGHDWGAIVAWMVAARHPERLHTLTAVSVPHPEAFADAYASPESAQRKMSSYIDVFRAPGDAGERMLRGDEGDGIRRMFEHVGLDPEAAAEHDAVHNEPGGLTAALNWYRATHPTLMRGVPPVAVPTLLVWSTLDPAISREAADGCARYVAAPFTYEVLDGVDHWVPELAADQLNSLLLAHLSQRT